jgi:RNA polymerase sigma-70 factor
VESQHADELTWAAACLDGDVAALQRLDAGPLRDAADHLRTLGFAAAAIDDAVQRGREKLIVAGGLAGYRGRGPLATYVRTAVVRLAIDDQRKVRDQVPLSELLAAPMADPELEYMRKLYAEHLAAAVKAAWDRIAPHERFVLSLRIYEAMSIDDLARVYQIHRANAARRAATARASLVSATRAALRERLAVGETTLDSILRIVTTSVQLPVDDAPEPVH